MLGQRFSCFCAMLLLLLLPTHHARASDFTGQVVGIIDGDTIDVMHNEQVERIRLNGIDCPEKGQPFGKKAKQFTSSLVYGKAVNIKTLRMDRHGRTVGHVLLPDGTNVSRELVKAGLAWWYRQYSKDASLGVLEQEAREAKRGLWDDPHVIPPWEVRHPKKKLPPVVSADLLAENPLAKGMDTTSVAIIGNRNSHIYQRPDCPNYTATAPKNRRMFDSTTEAEAAGYRVAGKCP